MTREWDFNGAGEILLVDKPADWTSFDVVHRVKLHFGIRKVGHAGTLDPRATGLLIICTGPQTKRLDRFIGYDKEYTGDCELGIVTPSFDMETPVSEKRDWSNVTPAAVRECAAGFLGVQRQEPPMYSAVKLNGRPLYKYARQGKSVERPHREIDIREFEVDAESLPRVKFRLVCSKGTYVRSLVNDLGARLGCGATLTSLRRTRVGPWSVSDAWTIERLLAADAVAGASPSLAHEDRTTT